MAAERGRVWSDEEIAVLLSAWGEEAIQRQLLGAVRNTIPYKAIAEELRKKGYERDFKQCREKIILNGDDKFAVFAAKARPCITV